MKPSPIINKEKAAARGNEARAALLYAASRPLWAIREDGERRLLSTIGDASLSLWMMEEEYDDDPDYVITEDGIAIIPVVGTLLDSEPNWWMNYLGYASTPHIGRMVQDAYEDSRVTSLALYVDSPGGQASGIATVANILFALRERGEKQIVALAKDACSAAYHLASQCDRIIVTPDGVTGCIGTVIIAADWSKMYAEMGVTVNRITSTGGETYKGAGAFGTELTDEQKADWKRICDESQSLFTANVARGRSLTPEAAAALADGRYYVGANGIALGLADNVMSIDEAMTLLAAGDEWPSPPPTTSPDPETKPDENDASRTGGQQANKELVPMNLPTAFLRGGKQKNEPAPEPIAVPVLSPDAEAILASLDTAGITTSEQLTATLRDAGNGKKAMEARRKEAEATAVRAFAQNTDRLDRAKKAIASATDFDDLQNLEAVYAEQIPSALANPLGQQTTNTGVVLTEEKETEAEYLQRRKREEQEKNAKHNANAR